MGTISLRLPESLHKKVRELAKYEAVLGKVRDVEPDEGDEWPVRLFARSDRRSHFRL
jgi:hypothetical protein